MHLTKHSTEKRRPLRAQHDRDEMDDFSAEDGCGVEVKLHLGTKEHTDEGVRIYACVCVCVCVCVFVYVCIWFVCKSKRIDSQNNRGNE